MSRKGGKDKGVYEEPKGSGKWYACWVDAGGNLRRKLIGTKENAKAYYIKQKAQTMEDKNFPERAQAKALRITLAQLVERMRPAWQVKATALDDDRYAAWWIEHLGGQMLSTITTADIAAARAKRLAQKTRQGRKTSPATANRHMTFLRRLFNLAIDEGIVQSNPCNGKALLKLKEQHSIKYLEEDSFPQLLAACKGKRLARLRRAVIVAVGTGMRAGEQFGMLRTAINLKKRTITLGKTKSGKTRYLAISDMVAEALSEQMASHKSRWVWPAQIGDRSCDATAMNRTFQRTLAKAGLPIMSWHSLRHSFGTWSAGEGADMASLKEAMGHESLTTTQIYTQVNANRVRKVFDLIGSQMANITQPAVSQKEQSQLPTT